MKTTKELEQLVAELVPFYKAYCREHDIEPTLIHTHSDTIRQIVDRKIPMLCKDWRSVVPVDSASYTN